MTHILVVDDMPICREPIVSALKLEGYQAVGVNNGNDALAYVRTQRPNLVLLDLEMPGVDGWTVLRALREDENSRQ